MKTCETEITVFWRYGRTGDDENKFNVSVFCMAHELTWQCLAKDETAALEIINNFPLVSGGLVVAVGKFLNAKEKKCLLLNIPHVKTL